MKKKEKVETNLQDSKEFEKESFSQIVTQTQQIQRLEEQLLFEKEKNRKLLELLNDDKLCSYEDHIIRTELERMYDEYVVKNQPLDKTGLGKLKVLTKCIADLRGSRKKPNKNEEDDEFSDEELIQMAREIHNDQ